MNREMNNNLMERYLYDVIRRIPEQQKEDIKKELQTLIQDMLEERVGDRKPTDQELAAVLTELGNPADLARKYRGEEKHLIGPRYYDQYWFLMKIVLVCAGAGMVISTIITAFVESAGMVFSDTYLPFGELAEQIFPFWSIPSILVCIFGYITIAFAVIEHFQIRLDLKIGTWSPEKIPQIPNKKVSISRVESTFGVVFQIIFASVFCFIPHLLGVWLEQGESMVIIPVFHMEIWNQVLPFLIGSFLMGLINEVVKLIAGRYNTAVAISTVLTGAIGFCLAVIAFKFYDIWNPQFVSEIEKITGNIFAGDWDVLRYWNTSAISNILLLIIFVGYVVECAKAIYCAIRYDK